MTAGRTLLAEGVRVLTENGTAVVVAVLSTGVKFRDSIGDVVHVEWDKLSTVRAITDGEVAALTEPLRPMWDRLDDTTRTVVLARLEIVQEIITGYRDGHPELARPGEPRHPFGPGFGVSESRRCRAMAVLLGYEGQYDREFQRRVRDGEMQSAAYNPSTIRNWVRAWKSEGLSALIDGRSIRPSKLWDSIDQRYRAVATEVLDSLDGDRSTVSLQELDRRIRIRLQRDGVTGLETPQPITQEFLSTLTGEKGAVRISVPLDSSERR